MHRDLCHVSAIVSLSELVSLKLPFRNKPTYFYVRGVLWSTLHDAADCFVYLYALPQLVHGAALRAEDALCVCMCTRARRRS